MEKDHPKGENNFWFKMVTNRDGIRLCKELAYSVSRIKVKGLVHWPIKKKVWRICTGDYEKIQMEQIYTFMQ